MIEDRFRFRVWDKEENKYKNGMEVFDYMRGISNPDRYILEHCAGLKDKNGKLIYEGDIIQTDYNGVELDKYIYRWESPAFYVEPIEKGKPTGSHYYHYAVCTERSTVIGNIHENQELLKDEE